MSNSETVSFVPLSGPYRGCTVSLDRDIPWATGRTDKLTIRDPIVNSKREYLVRPSGYVLCPPSFVVGSTACLVRQLHKDALERLT